MATSIPDYPDYDRGPHLAAVYIVGCVVSFLFVASRLTARFSIAGVNIDDYCMCITWIAFIPLTVLVSIMCFEGGTRHLSYLAEEPEHLVYVTKLNWVAQPLAIFCLGSGKIAVALLELRLLNRASVWRRWSLHIASGWTAINTVIMIVLTFAQCENPAALWDRRLMETTRCWDPKVQSSFSIYGAAVHALIDFYLAVIPVTLVWKLQTELRKKLALCALLGCGSITGICAAIKASKLSTLNARSDFTWETFSLFLWTGIEIILLIICGSIPALKPIYAICMGRRTGTYAYRSGSRPITSSPQSKKSTTRPRGNSDSETRGIAMAGVAPHSGSAAVCSRISEDEAEMQIEYEKLSREKGIQVTRAVAVEAAV
ncbi:hypothetical protein P280DRAFT_402157 [Massarina eburnea CBS 473.64]|uniref:Rhodopsin domain-containing protein n=1 Tax=Massarina eburnea CBS 473.64 TaxID=1395130 RepID=A0A6A6RX10_9PLEO|nr:hypothetical protein P280DRAFT_402157 [Massarina eburnea CBS 473.64]